METPANKLEPPTLLIDIDDVLCLNEPFGCAHVRNALLQPASAPPDLWQRIFREEAVQTLNALLEEFRPKVVITSSWISLLDKEHFIRVFEATNLQRLSHGLHEFWDAPTDYGTSRLEAIDDWLQKHHRGGPILIIDDPESGESLVESFHHQAGRALLCPPGSGFTFAMLEAARRALQTPYSTAEPWK